MELLDLVKELDKLDVDEEEIEVAIQFATRRIAIE